MGGGSGGKGGGGGLTHRLFQVSQSLYVKETKAYPGLLQPHCKEAVIIHYTLLTGYTAPQGTVTDNYCLTFTHDVGKQLRNRYPTE